MWANFSPSRSQRSCSQALVMELRQILVFLVSVVLAVGVVECHRRHRGRPRHRGPPPEGLYSWTRDLGRGSRAPEYAYVPPGGQIVYAQSTDDVLTSANIQPANSVYDFTQAVPIEILAPVNGPCYYTNMTVNLGQTIETLNSINSTVVSASNEVSLDGIATPLTQEQLENLYVAYPSVESTCAGQDVIPAYPQGAAPVVFSGPTNTLSLFSINSAVSVTTRRPQEHRSRGRYRGGSSGSGSWRRHRHHRRF